MLSYILVMILAVSGVVLGIRYMTAVPDVMSAEITQMVNFCRGYCLKKEILPGSLLSNIRRPEQAESRRR